MELSAALRLKQLQQLCKDGRHGATKTGAEEAQPDALLFIPGIDGRFNPGSQLAIKWLMLGATGRYELSNKELNEEHAALEDCALVVTRHGSSILYSAEAAPLVEPIISSWENVKEYALPGSDEDDIDLFEEHKVRTLSERELHVCDCTYGVPLPIGFDDYSDMEMWPLVQAFGL
ncbi:unnamed protein product, partial [Chrysoparadoxa australica]